MHLVLPVSPLHLAVPLAVYFHTSGSSDHGPSSNKNLFSGQQWHLCVPLLETPGNYILRRDTSLEGRF